MPALGELHCEQCGMLYHCRRSPHVIARWHRKQHIDAVAVVTSPKSWLVVTVGTHCHCTGRSGPASRQRCSLNQCLLTVTASCRAITWRPLLAEGLLSGFGPLSASENTWKASTARHCTVLYCTALTLCCTALHCTALHCTAHRTVLYCTAQAWGLSIYHWEAGTRSHGPSCHSTVQYSYDERSYCDNLL